MRPTIPIDLMVNLLVGESLAWASAGSVRRGEALTGRGLRTAAVLTLFTFVPFSIFYLAVYPDWSWSYYVDPGHISVMVTMAVPLWYLLAMVLGYAGAWAIARSGRTGALTALVAATALGVGAVNLLTLDRVMAVGTYSDFRSGGAVPLMKDPLRWWLLGMGAVFIPAWGYAIRRLKKGI